MSVWFRFAVFVKSFGQKEERKSVTIHSPV